jgi:DNA (cytosine-5)-methyltransferase 1
VAQDMIVGLFAGVGGLEHGFHEHGWRTEMFCEIDSGAQAVLADRFPDVDLVPDVRRLRSLPKGVVLVTAGFPCQDLSQAGLTEGIHGERSGLVDHVFRLVKRKQGGPTWLLLENVPFMLQLNRGRAMRHLTTKLEDLGYVWAYRVVDARAFGLPQRRPRVILLASRSEDPRQVLFKGDAGPRSEDDPSIRACGFYWTEGTRGLGWAVDATPTLKGGSTLGIASPPAIRMLDGSVAVPGITDAERLQGFEPGWTQAALDVPGVRRGHRWKLVGNAVSTRMSAWVADALAHPAAPDVSLERILQPGDPWPLAAWGRDGVVRGVDLSAWPIHAPYEHLAEFIQDPSPLSVRATAGFLQRAQASSLRFVPGFLDDVRNHLRLMSAGAA